jgi:uncharacterized membrane protein YbhN (UPF0104 family)
VSLGVLIWLTVDVQALVATISAANPLGLLLAVALLPANLALENVKWIRLVRTCGTRLRFADGLAAILCGYSFGILTPARIGELAGRAYKTRMIPVVRIGGLTMVDRLLSQFWYLLCGALAALYLAGASHRPAMFAAGIMAGSAGATLLVVALTRPAAVLSKLGAVGATRIARTVATFLTECVGSEAAVLFLLSGLRYLTIAMQFFVLLRVLGPDASPAPLFAGGLVVLFAKAGIPSITIGDLGVREAAAVVLASPMGLTSEASLAAALSLYGVNVLLPSLLGLLVVIFHRAPGGNRAGVQRGEPNG